MSVSTVLSHEFADRYIVEPTEIGEREAIRFSDAGANVEVVRYHGGDWYLLIDAESVIDATRAERLAAARAIRAAADTMIRLLES